MSEYYGGYGTKILTDQSAASGTRLDQAVVATRPLGKGRSVYVQCRMSTASATVGIGVILHEVAAAAAAPASVIGVAAPGPQTATATTLRDGNGSGDYWTQILVFDGANAPHYEVRITTAPSAGTVDVLTWTV